MPDKDEDFNISDDEYHMKEEGGGVSYGDELKTTSPLLTDIKKKINLKRILIPAGLIIIIIVVYQFLNWYSSASRTASEIQPKQQGSAIITRPQLAAPQAASSAAAEVSAGVVRPLETPRISSAAAAEETAKKMEALVQEVESNREQLANLNDALIKNQQAVNDLSGTVNSVSATLEAISGKVQQLVDQTAAKKKKIVLPEKPIYHLRAVIPGRAWLIDESDKTITVRVGNLLPGYGKVNFISSREGVVITDSGDVIQYGVNDY